jgi:hypothetical protein
MLYQILATSFITFQPFRVAGEDNCEMEKWRNGEMEKWRNATELNFIPFLLTFC